MVWTGLDGGSMRKLGIVDRKLVSKLWTLVVVIYILFSVIWWIVGVAKVVILYRHLLRLTVLHNRPLLRSTAQDKHALHQ